MQVRQAISVRQHNFMVVVSRVGKGPAPVDVAQGPDARNVCFELCVRRDITPLVGGKTHRGEIQRIGIGHPACGEQDMAAGKLRLILERYQNTAHGPANRAH